MANLLWIPINRRRSVVKQGPHPFWKVHSVRQKQSPGLNAGNVHYQPGGATEQSVCKDIYTSSRWSFKLRLPTF